MLFSVLPERLALYNHTQKARRLDVCRACGSRASVVRGHVGRCGEPKPNMNRVGGWRKPRARLLAVEKLNLLRLWEPTRTWLPRISTRPRLPTTCPRCSFTGAFRGRLPRCCRPRLRAFLTIFSITLPITLIYNECYFLPRFNVITRQHSVLRLHYLNLVLISSNPKKNYKPFSIH